MMLDFFRAIRISNVILVFLAQILLAYKVKYLNELTYSILFLSSYLIAIGNIENNILDERLDIECKKKPLNRLIEWLAKKNRYFYLEFCFLGFVLFLGVKLDYLIIYFGFSSFLLLKLYNYQLKKLPLVGNLAIAILCAGAVFVIDFVDLKIEQYTTDYILIIFLLTFIRELIKDKEDEICDRQFGYKTLAIVCSTIYIQLFIFSLLIVASISLFSLYNSWMFFKLLSLIFILLSFIFVYTNEWKKASLVIKLCILWGVVSMYFI